MRAVVASFALVAFGVAFSGCGGGGTLPASSPSPSYTGSRPAGNGDTFAFAGAMKLEYVRPPLTASPLPSPNPASSVTTVSTISQEIAVSTGATFKGRTGLFDFTIVESDVAPLKTTTLTSHEYLAYDATRSSTAVSIVGSVTASSDGAIFESVYGKGNGLLDVLPETPGNIGSAPNTAALTLTETDPDGQVTSRAVDADGTYTERASFPDGTTSLATQRADGTGSYSVPYVIPGTAFGDGLAPPNTVIAVAPPATNVVSYIPVSIAYSYGTAPSPAPLATPLATPTPVVRLVTPVWYPGGAAPAVPSLEAYVNAGSAALPQACDVPGSLLAGRAVNELRQTIGRVDIVFGETERETTTTYTAEGLGVVCQQLSDVVTHYYDFSGQSTRAFATSGTALQTDTLTETLALQSAALKTSSLNRAARGLTPASVVPPVRTSLRLRFERERLRRHAEIFRSLHRRAVKGLVK